MNSDSTFGAEPFQLHRLFEIGLDKTELDEETPPIAHWDLLKEKPGSRIGPYLITQVLGEGGMGIVYLAQQEEPVSRHVALKVIKPGMDSKRVIARFEAEKQALALMQHPNIADVYDAGITIAGRPYFVMEYVKGVPIIDYCDHHKLTIEERLRLFQQVCQAVQHAHQKGIIHRDIKPSNILVSMEDDRAIPKIIDFGVAKATDKPLTERTLATEDTQLLGTPEYMSPEQADMANEDIDTRSDVYSLGVLLYVLLTGVLPFESEKLRGSGIENIRKTIRETDPKTPSTRLIKLGEEATKVAEKRQTEVATLAKCLHRELEWIPLKAMHKERTERYRSASELADDIENYLNDAPLIAGPPSTIYRSKKFIRRHKALLIGISASLVVLVAAVIVSTILAIRAEQQADISNRVLNFLTNDVLMSSDSTRARRWQVTLSEVLDVASENLKTKFSDQPVVEATIRHTLGKTYLSLGKYSVAEPHIERAYQIRLAELGQKHPDTLASTASLGMLRLRQGKYIEAERFCSMAVEGRRLVLGPEHPDTLESMRELAVVYWYQHRSAEAEAIFSEVSELRRHVLGEAHPETLSAFTGLAWAYKQQNRYTEAESLFEHVFQICCDRLGEDHDMTRRCIDGLVGVYTDMGRLKDAEQLGLKGLELKRRALGEEHPETLESIGALAWIYTQQQERYEEAERLYKILQETHDRLGLENDRVLRLVGLATLYIKQARFGEAEPLLLQEYQRIESLFGPKNPRTINMLNQLVKLYEVWNKPEKAKEWRSKLPQTEAVTE